MKYSDIQVINNNTDNRKKEIFIIIMTFLMSYAGIMAYMSTWGEYMIYRYYILIAVSVGIVTAIIADMLRKVSFMIRGILIIPMLSVFLPAGIMGGFNGIKIWIDVIIYNWNQLHEGGITLMPYTGGYKDILAFSLLLGVVTGELVYYIVKNNSSILISVYILFWIIIQLISGNADVAACGILLAAGIIMAIMGSDFYITGRSIILSVIVSVVCLLSAAAGMNELEVVTTFRTDIADGVNDIRYGKDQLPAGSIKSADTLLSDTDNLLTIWSEQDKDIYLNAFVGARYDDNLSIWKTLPDSAYGGDNHGMLEWLYDNGVDPLKQTAQYYELCETEARPQPNNIKIEVDKATRRYVYVPASIASFVKGNAGNNKDINYTGKSISGIDNYEITEISSQRPSELLLIQDWVKNPVTQKQKAYIQAESVYRDFVYDNYTSVSSEYYELMKEWFWDDYQTDSDGIYEAVSRVRAVLHDKLTYSIYPENVPDNVGDALMWYISNASVGNSVIYASVAVQALRTHGIPARYVEGYYVSSSDIKRSSGRGVTLTGKNTHAWVEVYFDGIGWQTVDVTPGYYKDAAVLKQMINTPDDIHKTASFDDGMDIDTGKITDSQEIGHTDIKDKAHAVMNTGRMLAGILAVVIIIITIILSALEIIYYCVSVHQRKIYDNSSPGDKVKIIEKCMYQLLSIKGIDATLGWHTKQIDDIISESITNIEPGDYIRVSAILEKLRYGGCEPEPYELRTLEIFANEIFNDHTNEKGIAGFKVRHIALISCLY